MELSQFIPKLFLYFFEILSSYVHNFEFLFISIILIKIILRTQIKRFRKNSVLKSFFRIYSDADILGYNDDDNSKFWLKFHNIINFYSYLIMLIIALIYIINNLLLHHK